MATSTRQVVVDASDTEKIRYVGAGWVNGFGGDDHEGISVYNHSMRGTSIDGSLSFTFRGTDVNVIGAPLISIGVGKLSWKCFVDNILIGEYAGLAPGNLFICTKYNLSDTEHIITLNVTTTSQQFWLDSIRYTPSPSLLLEDVTVFVDNGDLGIHLDPYWVSWDVTQLTQTHNSTMTFSFIGTSVAWIGVIPENYPRNSTSGIFSIDGGEPRTFPLIGLDPEPAMVQRKINQLFFTASGLSTSTHTLSVTYQGDDHHTPLALDFLYITTSTPSNTTNDSFPPPPPLSGLATHHITVITIAGFVAGGLAVILMVLGLSFRWYKRRKLRSRVVTGEIDPTRLGMQPLRRHIS
ncbi:hypothetical protein BDZ94DRAFT_1312916 [Collybia nuda]|uniref:Uncharacterized protein n=1 Tax=Collybia nuda TaxID=64659 RepID=A0A9P5XXX4_9AGAR|nr:hypothetical protein BDZ94DRAFT_1312916 [Collybia nuda]